MNQPGHVTLLSIHRHEPDIRINPLPVARRCCFALGGQDCRGAENPDNGVLKVDPVERQSLFTQAPQYLFFVQHGTVRPNEHITLRINRFQRRIVLVQERSVETISVKSKHAFRSYGHSFEYGSHPLNLGVNRARRTP